ncbi:hypothetical protein A1O3_01530 [Capronia epimyces CBS 606.96]|uniref:Uncharacterized protein n=1 Tax=Capronia epimyces CBS 606.96 TaxID=1182542 RepID=W9ZEP6_9EURO|nr:uncharacterized protein A1O3_01530 [Capronia epimyces CBS 606.96]EXJ92974.1 hypothetical protein A1O3_01530 [Capronia epimyces CBS 606.96]
MVFTPETYRLRAKEHCPNNELPVLIYRDCLPLPLSEEKAAEFLEAHAWVKKGCWGHIGQRHFHPNTHECYGIFQGSSTLLLGCGHNDTTDGGLEVEVHAGDVVVLPAGTGHCSTKSSKDYKYIGVYPEGAPHWTNQLGKAPIDLEAFRNEIGHVEMPSQDPVNGVDGPLILLWTRT